MIIDVDQIEYVKCKRVGIIPYVEQNGTFQFLMGYDSRSNDLCDFGGRISGEETNIQAAIREFMEETKEILDPHELSLASCGVYDKRNNMCILFCKVNKEGFFETAKEQFKNAETDFIIEEMTDIEWLSVDQMKSNIYGYSSKFWDKVKYTFSNTADFNDELLSKL